MLKSVLLVLCFLMMTGCANRYERMVGNGFPPGYSMGYTKGRGDAFPLGWGAGTPLYEHGFADGQRDNLARVNGDPAPPAFTPVK